MPNTAVRAAAEGLPTRRQMLAGAGAAIVALPTGAKLGAGLPAEESAELLALARELDAAIAAADQAQADFEAAASHYRWIYPAPPKELRAPVPALRFSHVSADVDELGDLITDEKGRPRMWMTAADLEEAAERWSGAHLYPGNHIRELLPRARAHEAARTRAAEEAGIMNAREVQWSAAGDLWVLAQRIAEAPLPGLAGLQLKARAFLASARHRLNCTKMLPHPEAVRLAEAVLALG